MLDCDKNVLGIMHQAEAEEKSKASARIIRNQAFELESINSS